MGGQRFAIYELTGDAVIDAVTLDLRVRDFMRDNPLQQTGPLLEINESVQKRYAQALDEIRETDPDLLARLGLDRPVVQVENVEGSAPRAYEDYPQLYWTSSLSALYLLFCPIDYEGRHFIPAGGVLCDDKDIEGTEMGHALYKKHFWIADGPVVSARRRGVALPAGFDAAHAHMPSVSGLQAQACFKAEGETLALLQRHEDYKAGYEAAWRAFSNAVHDWAARHMPDHYVNIMMRREQEQSILTMSFRQHKTGTPVPFAHADWIIDRQCQRDWTDPATGIKRTITLDEYEMRPNPDTEEGQEIHQLLKLIPAPPHALRHPELVIHGAQGELYPLTHNFPEGTFLAYNNVKDGEILTPPRDCVAVPPALLTWLDRDRQDRQWQIDPPPMPAALSRWLTAPGGSSAPRVPQP